MKHAPIAAAMIALSVSACSNGESTSLLFGQTHMVGLTINTGATTQSAELTLGYRDADIAVIPISIKQANGDSTNLMASASGDEDALSVLGQFEVGTSAAASGAPSASLGKFFATGIAARYLAQGYQAKLSK